MPIDSAPSAISQRDANAHDSPPGTAAWATSAKGFIDAIVETWLPPTCPLTGQRVFGDAVLHSSQLDAINLDASGIDDDGIGAIFEYGGPLADLVRQAKFHPDESAGRVLTTLWAKEAAQHIQTRRFEADAISYVPAHWRRRATRGFDLPALLAGGLSKVLSVPLFHGVTCHRFVEPLSLGASRAERAVANHNRFVVDNGPPSKVILVDDVVTTGATLSAARAAFETHGTDVCSVVLARTDRDPSTG